MTIDEQPKRVFTIGHSTRPIEMFLALLRGHGIQALADVRRFPASRHNPQFNQNMLVRSLETSGIAYRHMVMLGGRREGSHAGLAGYAHYANTEEFQIALAPLETLATACRVAIMCAEALPSHCHRSFIADALERRGFSVTHILSAEHIHEAQRAPLLPGL